jgi:putative phosphoesterase
MKVAILSDIHGNHFALEAVLKDCKNLQIDHLLVLGDIVGYYYHPEIVLELLSHFPYDIIKGNHENILQDLSEGKIEGQQLKNKYGSGHEMALKNLDAKTLNWLFSLPDQKFVTLDKVSFQMSHGSPWDPNYYLYPTEEKALLDKCNVSNCDFVLVGHSHYAFSYRCEESTLINCGSVGQSRQRGGMAHWASVSTENKVFQLNATPYDASQLIKEVNLMDSEDSYSSKILSR